MVRQYLLNYQQELIGKKLDIEKALQNNKLLLKENAEFMRFLEASEDKIYDSFSPQNYKTEINQRKKKELEEKQKEMEKNDASLKQEMESISQKIIELDRIIKLVKEMDQQSTVQESKLKDSDIFRLKLLETQEHERQRIARELHDSTVQNLTGIIHKIELCQRVIDLDPNRCKLELKNISTTVKDSIHGMREVIYNLHPMSLDDIGIDATIERELDRIRKNNDIKINYRTKGNSQGILPVIGLTMLRIIQEACNNTIKHANAKNIWITIDYLEKEIDIKISDDGVGFDVEYVRSIASNQMNSGFGISMMYERVYMMSGSIEIASQENKGTTFYITIPKKEEK